LEIVKSRGETAPNLWGVPCHLRRRNAFGLIQEYCTKNDLQRVRERRKENFFITNNMNFLNSTSSVVLILSLSILGIIIAPLVASLVLRLFFRLFKFPKNDFKTALYCNLIIIGIYVGIGSSLNILFLDQIQGLSSVFTLLSLIISLIAGTYVIHKFYGSSLVKSFFALFLTGSTAIAHGINFCYTTCRFGHNFIKMTKGRAK